MIIIGIGFATAFIPTFEAILNQVTARGYADDVQTYSLVSGLWSSLFAMGLIFDFVCLSLRLHVCSIFVILISLSTCWTFVSRLVRTTTGKSSDRLWAAFCPSFTIFRSLRHSWPPLLLSLCLWSCLRCCSKALSATFGRTERVTRSPLRSAHRQIWTVHRRPRPLPRPHPCLRSSVRRCCFRTANITDSNRITWPSPSD